MTKTQAIKEFKETILPHLWNNKDIPAKREAWVNYVDSLQKSGIITQKQAETWDQIF